LLSISPAGRDTVPEEMVSPLLPVISPEEVRAPVISVLPFILVASF